MVILDETEVATIDDPGFSTIQESGQHNSFVDIDLRVFPSMFFYRHSDVYLGQSIYCP